jgi:hypothetical protein
MLQRGFGMLKACAQVSAITALLLIQLVVAIPRLFFVLLAHITGRIQEILNQLLEAIVPLDPR